MKAAFLRSSGLIVGLVAAFVALCAIYVPVTELIADAGWRKAHPASHLFILRFTLSFVAALALGLVAFALIRFAIRSDIRFTFWSVLLLCIPSFAALLITVSVFMRPSGWALALIPLVYVYAPVGFVLAMLIAVATRMSTRVWNRSIGATLALALFAAVLSVALTWWREVTLKEDLFTLHAVVSQYTLDKHKRPHSLDDLMTAGYLKRLPMDPMTGRNDTWVLKCSEDRATPGIEGIDSEYRSSRKGDTRSCD